MYVDLQKIKHLSNKIKHINRRYATLRNCKQLYAVCTPGLRIYTQLYARYTQNTLRGYVLPTQPYVTLRLDYAGTTPVLRVAS